jgi:hypothetical protein
MNDTRIWSAAQMRVLFPQKKQTRASPSSRRCTKEVVSSAQLLCLQHEELPLSVEGVLKKVSF